MRAEKALATLLAGDAGIAALVGSKIYGGFVPQETAAPFLMYRKEGATREYRLTVSPSAPNATVLARMSVLIVAKEYDALKALGEAVRLALVGRTGTHGGTTVLSLLLAEEGSDEYDPDLGEFAQVYTFDLAHTE